MPLTFNIENDSLVKLGANIATKKAIEKMILMTDLSPYEIAVILDVEEIIVINMKKEIEEKKKKK
ncbi:MAG: hypothetical protein RLZZ292_2803 [Bacteroidota bacterium]|jgi:hypothetical protein